MKFSLPITTLIASALLATNVGASKFPAGISWDYLIGAGTDKIKASNKQVVNIDLETANGLTSYLHGKGQKVICYFSGGTMQASRKVDYDDYLKAGVAISDKSSWKNHYIDIRKKDKLYPLIKKRMQRAKSFGCDGVEVDSIGLYIHLKEFTKNDTITFGKWVAQLAHEHGLAVGLKNAAGCAHDLEPYFDFAIVESCAESTNVCSLYTPFTSHGKAVFTVHYGNRIGSLGGSSKAPSKLRQELGGHGFTCAFNVDQSVTHNSSNFDCSKGNYDSDSGSSPKPTTVTVAKTTTTTAAKAEPTNKSNPVVPNPIVPNPVNQNTKQVSPSVSSAPGAPGASSTPGAPNAPGAPGAAAATTTKQPADNANGAKKEVGNAVGANKNEGAAKDSNENSSNAGTVALFACGGVATAAVAGFVFLKKHKKFTSKSDDFSLDV